MIGYIKGTLIVTGLCFAAVSMFSDLNREERNWMAILGLIFVLGGSAL